MKFISGRLILSIIYYIFEFNAPVALPPTGGGRAVSSIMFTVYAIYSKNSDKIYIGQTVDIELRLKQHNDTGEGHLGKFTSQYKGPWILIYKEEFMTRSEALKRERQLKSFRGREFVKNLIKK